MEINKLIRQYKLKAIPGNLTPNYVKLPKNFINIDHAGVELFNKLYKAVYKDKFNKIVRTKSGGICIKQYILVFPAYDIIQNKNGIEMTVLTGDHMCRIIFSGILNRTEDKHKITGTQAWRLFIKTLNDFNINLEDYRISPEEGLKVKEKFKVHRELVNSAYRDLTFEHVNHIDFNSSYPAGLVNTHAEFKNAIEYLYERRHESEIYKSILNNSISGYMQSKYVKYGFAQLCVDAVLDNVKRLEETAAKIEKAGGMVISYNTDGIWYKGKVYHDENEGTKLGQYKNDHIDCKFRAKSGGSYEYIENGKYKAVVNGTTRLDRIKDRDNWEWGDIYNEECQAVMYYFVEGEGIYEKGQEN